LVAINDEHLKSVIMHGNRPPLDAITGPADLVSFVTECIAMCWHESPNERPPFDCTYCQHVLMELICVVSVEIE